MTTALQVQPKLPSTVQLLTSGGDARIVCDPKRGTNKYGASPSPDPEILAYGSSTASTISTAGFAGARALRLRLLKAALIEEPAHTYAHELDRIRRELIELCGLKLPGLEIIFGASGTDLHLIATQLASPANSPLMVIMVEAAETGTGVPDALNGRHYGECTTFGGAVTAHAKIDGILPIEAIAVPSRDAQGQLRDNGIIEAEIEAHVLRSVSAGQRVLLTLTDVSKSGSISPSPACVLALRNRFPSMVEVLVDACQFRLAPATLQAYLEHDFIVAITGSKFVTGPAFCGALLVPKNAASRMRRRPLSPGLREYSARADWPHGWAAQADLDHVPNYGLLLRWEAALVELRSFRTLAEHDITAFLERFSAAVKRRISNDPVFEALPVSPLDRSAILQSKSWDHIQTIFPFLLKHPATGNYFTHKETSKVHELLGQNLKEHAEIPFRSVVTELRCRVGQPVSCGQRGDLPVSAMRLCISSRLIVDALSPEGRGADTVIAEAIAVLDKAAMLAALPV